MWTCLEARDHDGSQTSAAEHSRTAGFPDKEICLIFLNDNSEVRAGWKFAIYVAFFLIFWVATGLALSMVVYRYDSLASSQLATLGLNEIALLVPAVAAMLLTIKFVDHRPARTFGRLSTRGGKMMTRRSNSASDQRTLAQRLSVASRGRGSRLLRLIARCGREPARVHRPRAPARS